MEDIGNAAVGHTSGAPSAPRRRRPSLHWTETVQRFGWAPALGSLALLGCSSYRPFDSAAHLRAQFVARAGSESAPSLRVPFELSAEITALIDARYKAQPNERRRVEQALDFVFERVGLQYSLAPTRDAVGTFAAREGNCLSFVNLFVGVARHLRLNPFYVEVTDYQRWGYRDGLVVSHGHIVAGLRVAGQLKTYDFLPYRAKTYRAFEPIDDLTAAAHFYNNLGAEAMMAGDFAGGEERIRAAVRIAPRFVKALNNLGVCLTRKGDLAGAEETLRRGLEIDPDNVAVLSNLARLYQTRGDAIAADGMLARVHGAQHSNPFYFVYEAERLLAQGEVKQALAALVQGLRQDSEVPEIHLGFIKVYLALGDLGRARHHLERALKLDATNPEARRYAALLAAARP